MAKKNNIVGTLAINDKDVTDIVHIPVPASDGKLYGIKNGETEEIIFPEPVDTSKWEIRVEDVVKTGYGALYNGYAVDESELNNGFIEGFIVPSIAQYQELFDLLGGNSVAGSKLMANRISPVISPRWRTGGVAKLDTVNFKALPSSFRYNNGSFDLIEWAFLAYSSTSVDISKKTRIYLAYNSNTVNINETLAKTYGFSIRCVRALSELELSLSDGTYLPNVQDADGNWYEVVKIGNYGWLGQNLRTTKYANGNLIANVTDNGTWSTLTSGAYCWFNNNIDTAGVIYTDESIEITTNDLIPINEDQKVPKEYISGLTEPEPFPEAPINGLVHGRKDAAWVELDYVDKSSDETITGVKTFEANIIMNNEIRGETITPLIGNVYNWDSWTGPGARYYYFYHTMNQSQKDSLDILLSSTPYPESGIQRNPYTDGGKQYIQHHYPTMAVNANELSRIRWKIVADEQVLTFVLMSIVLAIDTGNYETYLEGVFVDENNIILTNLTLPATFSFDEIVSDFYETHNTVKGIPNPKEDGDAVNLKSLLAYITTLSPKIHPIIPSATQPTTEVDGSPLTAWRSEWCNTTNMTKYTYIEQDGNFLWLDL